MDRVHKSCGPVVHGGLRVVAATELTGAHLGYTKTKGRVHLFSPWALAIGAVAEEGWRQGGTNSGRGDQCGASGGAEKWSYMGQIITG
jgi:hypothetical protein